MAADLAETNVTDHSACDDERLHRAATTAAEEMDGLIATWWSQYWSQ